MKVLLAEAPFSYDKSIVKRGERSLPLGIAYIAGFVRKHLPDVKVKAFTGGLGEFEAVVKDFAPDLIGISAMTTSYPAGVEMARVAKRIFHDLFVVVGGQHASSVGAQVLREVAEVDFICIGEGEKFTVELLQEIRNGTRNWKSIAGIVFRENGSVVLGEPRNPESNLDDFPFPAVDLFDLERFKFHDHMQLCDRIVSMVSSRGCVRHCSFCSSFVTMGREYRFRSAANVVDEIEQLVRDYQIDGIVFWDDAFTFKPERVHTFCELLRSRGIKIRWFCMSRTDAIDERLARRMADSGCVMISFGLESGSPETLKRIHKQVNLEDAKRTITICNNAGIRTQGTFILGFPFEELADIDRTIHFALRSGLHMAIFFSFTPFPGTEAWNSVKDARKPENIDEWENFVCNTALSKSWNPRLSDDQLKHMVVSAHRKFYLRPMQIWRILATIKSAGELKYYIRGMFEFISNLLKRH